MTSRRTVGRRAMPDSMRKTRKLPPIYVTEDFEQMLVDAANTEGKDFSNFGREVFEKYVNTVRPSSDESENPNLIHLKVSTEKRAKLQKLSEAMNLPDVDGLAYWILLNAADKDIGQLKAFMFEEPNREEEKPVAAPVKMTGKQMIQKMDEDKGLSPKPAAKPARKGSMREFVENELANEELPVRSRKANGGQAA